jgi:hypothetical protein
MMASLAPIRNFFGGILRGRGAQVASGAMRSDPPPMGTREFLEQYETSPWVRGMLQKVGQSIGSTVWQLWRIDRETQVFGHRLERLLRRPNPMMTGRAIWSGAQVSLDLVGCCFFVKERNGLRVTTGLWPIPAHWVAETPTPAKPTFRLSHGKLQATIPQSEVLWINDPAPENPYRRGSGIMQALGDEIETDEYSAKHAKQLFFNRAMPEVVIMDPEAKEDEIRVYERKWNQRLRGLWRALQPYFTNREFKFWQPQQMNLENLTLVPLRKWQRDIQLQAYGMPPEQMGLLENSNRATIDASDFVYQDRIVQPRREFLADALTIGLASEFDNRIEVRFLSTVPGDKAHELAVMAKFPWAFTRDQILVASGRPAIGGKEGQERCVPLNSYITTDPLDQEQRPSGAGGTQRAGDEDASGAAQRAGQEENDDGE